MKPLALLILLAPLAGCAGDAVDATAHPPITETEYATWPTTLPDGTVLGKLETWGELPGHGGDTYRIIYANPIAQRYEGGQYAFGPDDASTSILVKEIYDLASKDGAPAPGNLQYVAIMRRVGPPPQGLSDEGGWLFSETPTRGGSETHYAYCWASCHVDAPYHGAWFDYAKPSTPPK